MPIIFYCGKCWTELSIPEDVGITAVQCECGHNTPLPAEINIVYLPTGKEVFTYDDETPECIEVIVAHDLSSIPVIGVLLYAVFYFIVMIKLGTTAAAKSFWLKQGAKRLWTRTGKPLAQIFVGFLILVVLVAIFCPPLVGNEKAANDNAAQAMLKSIVTAQATYTTQYKRYASSITELCSSGILNADALAGCSAVGTDSNVVNGYIYEMTAGRDWTATSFFVRCRPEAPTAGTNCYATDTTGRIVTTEPYQ